MLVEWEGWVGWLDGWWLDEGIDGWMDGWWMDGWMDGWIEVSRWFACGRVGWEGCVYGCRKGREGKGRGWSVDDRQIGRYGGMEVRRV